jgi:hypothetical protein
MSISARSYSADCCFQTYTLLREVLCLQTLQARACCASASSRGNPSDVQAAAVRTGSRTHLVVRCAPRRVDLLSAQYMKAISAQDAVCREACQGGRGRDLMSCNVVQRSPPPSQRRSPLSPVFSHPTSRQKGGSQELDWIPPSFSFRLRQ